MESLQSVIEEVKKTSYAAAARDSRSDARNVGSRDIQQGQAPNYNTNNYGNGNGNYRRPTRSYYGSSNSGTGISKSMGAPLPSRFIVIERI